MMNLFGAVNPPIARNTGMTKQMAMKLRNALLLIFGVLLTSCAWAQEISSAQELHFEEVPYTAESLEKYSFLKNTDEFVQQVSREETYVTRPLKVYVSELNDALLETPILLVHYIGSTDCGTHGCGLSGYERLSDGTYKRLAIYVVANQPIYKLACDGAIYLITTGGGGSSAGFARWLYADGTLKHTAKSEQFSEITTCNN